MVKKDTVLWNSFSSLQFLDFFTIVYFGSFLTVIFQEEISNSIVPEWQGLTYMGWLTFAFSHKSASRSKANEIAIISALPLLYEIIFNLFTGLNKHLKMKLNLLSIVDFFFFLSGMRSEFWYHPFCWSVHHFEWFSFNAMKNKVRIP